MSSALEVRWRSSDSDETGIRRGECYSNGNCYLIEGGLGVQSRPLSVILYSST